MAQNTAPGADPKAKNFETKEPTWHYSSEWDKTSGGVNPSYACEPNSTVCQASTSKEDAKNANNPSKVTETAKADAFNTQATGANPEAPIKAPENVVADYYRYGKFKAGEEREYETPPRMFDAIDEKIPASIRIFGVPKNQGEPRDLIPGYTKFFIESVQEAHTERTQVIETFGDFYVFCFGERPPVYTFSGTLMNTRNANWVTDFMFMYDRYLRGTRCAQMNASAIITYGGRQVEGLITNVGTQTNAANDGAASFTFSLIVFERKYFNFSADMGYATDDNMNRIVDTKFTELLKQVAGKEGSGSSDPQVSKAIQKAKDAAAGKSTTGATK